MSETIIGRVYKINDILGLNLCYVGSTLMTLSKRWSLHKCTTDTSIYPYILRYGVENFEMILIKEYRVVDMEHLRAYEQLWISRLKCLNIKNTLWLKKTYNRNYYQKNVEKFRSEVREYRIKNLEKIKLARKIFYQKNKGEILPERKNFYHKNAEKINLRRKEKIKCECGVMSTRASLSRHKKTNKHKNLMKNL